MKTNLIENKYYKVLVAAQRTKQLKNGARPLVQLANMKLTAIALQEIEAGLISFDVILDPQELAARRD